MEEFTFAAAGDAMVTRKISHLEDNKNQAKLYKMIREADAAMVNLEMPINGYRGYVHSKQDSTWSFSTDPRAADELKSVGFNLFSLANNHIGDYSQDGMIQTMEELEKRNLTYSGMGRDLASARSPSYLETPAGRVAMISVTSRGLPGTEAGEANTEIEGRPGIYSVRKETRYVVTDTNLEKIKQIHSDLGLDEIKQGRNGLVPLLREDPAEFSFLDIGGNAVGAPLVFERGPENKVYQKIDEADIDTLVDSIRKAKQQADWVVVSFHQHEGNLEPDRETPVPRFLEEVAHACVDAGADLFVTHGVHGLRGIEIKDETPIFYGIGGFAMQMETMAHLAARDYRNANATPDATPIEVLSKWSESLVEKRGWWSGIVPLCTFQDGTIHSVELVPIDTFNPKRTERGNPAIADETIAKEYISDINTQSDYYNTTITFEDGIGVVELN